MAKQTERAILAALAGTACLAVLGALLFPVYAGGGRNPRTACLSNMKQLGTGIAIYMADHDDRLPIARTSSGLTVVGWGARIYPFVKNPKVYTDRIEIEGLKSPEKELFRVSYAMNANAAARPDAAVTNGDNVSRIVLLYEIEGARQGRGGDLMATLALSPAGDGAAGGSVDSTDPNVAPMARPATGALDNSHLDSESVIRHGEKTNVVHLDTSARATAPNEVSAGANARKSNDAQTAEGCWRADLPGFSRPCAESAARREHRSTFSMK